jgi:hypothetical protein
MRRIIFLFIILSFLIFSLVSSSSLSEKSKDFPAGSLLPEKEELTYQLTWLGILAGTAKLSVSEKTIKWNKVVYHITSQADSSEFLSLIYRVEDRVNTYIDAAGFYPLYYSINQREGHYKANRTIIFDQKNTRASFIKNIDPPMEYFVPPAVQDPLSSFFYVRRQGLKPGNSIYVDTFSGNKTYRVEVQIIKRERIKTIFGTTDTILIKPILNFHGIFRHKGNIYIWLTDDERKLPVRMKTEIVFGSVSATLVSYKKN